MKIIGKWEPKQEPVDYRKYVANCQNSNCRCVIEFRGYDIKYIHQEGEQYKGEFGMMCKKMDRYFYAITCPNCNELIWLGDDERIVLGKLKNRGERERALKKYDDEHDVYYD